MTSPVSASMIDGFLLLFADDFEQPRLDLRVAHALGVGPRETMALRPREIIRHRSLRQTDGERDVPLCTVTRVSQSQNLSNLPHGCSFRHRASVPRLGASMLRSSRPSSSPLRRMGLRWPAAGTRRSPFDTVTPHFVKPARPTRLRLPRHPSPCPGVPESCPSAPERCPGAPERWRDRYRINSAS